MWARDTANSKCGGIAECARQSTVHPHSGDSLSNPPGVLLLRVWTELRQHIQLKNTQKCSSALGSRVQLKPHHEPLVGITALHISILQSNLLSVHTSKPHCNRSADAVLRFSSSLHVVQSDDDELTHVDLRLAFDPRQPFPWRQTRASTSDGSSTTSHESARITKQTWQRG